MKTIIKTLLLLSLIATSCNSHAGQNIPPENNPQDPAAAIPQEIIEIRQTDTIREALLALIHDPEATNPYQTLVKNQEETLKHFSHLCSEQPYTTRYKGDSIIHTYTLPKHKGTLQLTRYPNNHSETLARLNIHIKDIPYIKTIYFVTTLSPPTDSRQEYQRGSLTETNY